MAHWRDADRSELLAELGAAEFPVRAAAMARLQALGPAGPRQSRC
jgi:hypothetical protein